MDEEASSLAVKSQADNSVLFLMPNFSHFSVRMHYNFNVNALDKNFVTSDDD